MEAGALNRMVLEFPSRAENVGLARIAVATFAAQCEFTLSDLEEIKVVVSEAVTNSIVHGYGEDPRGMIRIIAQIFPDRLEVTVEDGGRGIEDVEAAVRPKEILPGERLGVGFMFIKAFTDDFSVYSRPGEGTRVTMVRYVKRVAVQSAQCN